MNDRDITDSTWNQYLKQYRDRYLCYRDEQGVWVIRCKHGNIQPYSIMKKQCVAVIDFKTRRQLTFFLKKLQYRARCAYEITQQGDTDICLLFDEADLNKFVYLFKIRRKKQLSDETREKLRQNLILARKRAKVVQR